MEIKAFAIHLSRFVLLHGSLPVSICIGDARIACFNLLGNDPFASDKDPTLGLGTLYKLHTQQILPSPLHAAPCVYT